MAFLVVYGRARLNAFRCAFIKNKNPVDQYFVSRVGNKQRVVTEEQCPVQIKNVVDLLYI